MGVYTGYMKYYLIGLASFVAFLTFLIIWEQNQIIGLRKDVNTMAVAVQRDEGNFAKLVSDLNAAFAQLQKK